jgi:drug/metabolite transporter (DMT)-like permease
MTALRLPSASIVAMFVLTGVGVGLVVSCNRLATTGGVPFIPFVFWESVIGGGAMLAILLARRRRPGLTPGHLRAYAIIGGIGISVPYTIMAMIASKLPAGILALQLALVPMATYVIAMALRMDRLELRRAAGLLLGLGGVLFILLPEASLPAPEMRLWLLVGLVVPMCVATSIIACEHYPPPESGAIEMTCGLMLAGAIFVLPLMAISGSWWVFTAPLDWADGSVVLAGLIVPMCWAFAFEIIRRAGSVFYSTVLYLETLAGVGWGIVIFGEHHAAWVWISLTLLLGGIALVSRRDAPAPEG